MQIQLPDGSMRDYPDTKPDAEIEAELQQEFPIKKETKVPFDEKGRYVGGFPGRDIDEVYKMLMAEKDPTRQQSMLDAYQRYLNREDQPRQADLSGDPNAERSFDIANDQPVKIELNNMANGPMQGYVASPEEITAAAQQQEADMASEPGAELDPAAGMSRIEKFLVGAGGSLEKFNQYMEENWGGGKNPKALAAMKERTKLYDKYSKNLGGWGVAGEVAPEMIASAIPVARAGRLLAGGARAVGAGRAAPLVGDVAANAAYSGGRAAAVGDENIGEQALYGAAGAGAGHLIGGLAQRGVGPAMNKSAQVLNKYGIVPTWGQALGGRTGSRIEQAASHVFGLKGAIGKAQRGALHEYNQAEVNQALKPLGKEVKSFGEDATVEANKIISDAYEKAKDHIYLPASSRRRLLARAWSEINPRTMAPTSLATVQRTVRERIVRAGANIDAPLNGHTWKDIDQILGEKIRLHLGGTASAEDREIAAALRVFQDHWRDAVRPSLGSSPEYVTMLKNANEAYRNMVPIEKAMHGAIGDMGEFNPTQMARALGSEGRARGTKAYPELNKAARELMGDEFGRTHPWGLGPTAGLYGATAGLSALGFGMGWQDSAHLALALGALGKGGSHAIYNKTVRKGLMRGLSGAPGGKYLERAPITGAEFGAQIGREKAKRSK